MFSALSEPERDVITAVVFLGTFFVTFGVGRFLKRRAGVKLGLLYRLFCLMLAFYAAIAVYGVHASWKNHVGAAVILLSTALVVALVNRYVWDLYYERKRQTTIPHFLREVVGGVIFLIVTASGPELRLSCGSAIERGARRLRSCCNHPWVRRAELFLGIIGGVAIQINRPYKVGDWLQVGERFAEVMEINWRSTRLRTNDAIYLDIPNNEMVGHTIVNLHYPTEVHAMRIRVGVEYKNPPNRVKDALFRAASTADGVLAEPKVRIFLVDFADSAVIYEIKFYMGNHSRINEINDAVRTNVWYELKRQGITIPFPIRTLQLERKAAPRVHEEQAEARAILRDEALFECLSDEQIDSLVQQSRVSHFGRGERVIREGAEGDSMFVLLRGAAEVSISKNGTSIPVASLKAPDCFGEMSLLTGERRTATVRAETDCQVMEIGKPVMAEVLRASPDCLERLSELLAKRKMETEGLLKEAGSHGHQQRKEREYKATFLHRLQTFFEL